VGGLEPHRSGARRAVQHGTDRCPRSLESWIHVRLEDGDRRDPQVERRRVHAGMAEPDRDGCGDEAAGGRDVEGLGNRAVSATNHAPRTTPREGQTFAGESLLVRYANFVKLPHTIFALPFALLGLVVASRETPVTWRTLGLVVLADGIATPAGYLAVTGRWSDPWWVLPAGALAVTFWVGGFDVFYALPDEAFDRAERLASLVVRLGQARAILLAKALHGLALV